MTEGGKVFKKKKTFRHFFFKFAADTVLPVRESEMTEREESVLRNRKMVQRTNDFATGWKAALVNFGWFDDPFLKQISSQEFQSSFEKQRATLWIMK